MVNYKNRRILEFYKEAFKEAGLNKCFLLITKPITPSGRISRLNKICFYSDESIASSFLRDGIKTIPLKEVFNKNVANEMDCVLFELNSDEEIMAAMLGEGIEVNGKAIQPSKVYTKIQLITDNYSNYESVINKLFDLSRKNPSLLRHLVSKVGITNQRDLRFTNLVYPKPYIRNTNHVMVPNKLNVLIMNNLMNLDDSGEELKKFMSTLTDNGLIYFDEKPSWLENINNGELDGKNKFLIDLIAKEATERVLSDDHFKRLYLPNCIDYCNKFKPDWGKEFIEKYDSKDYVINDDFVEVNKLKSMIIDFNLTKFSKSNRFVSLSGFKVFLDKILKIEEEECAFLSKNEIKENDSLINRYVYIVKDNPMIIENAINDFVKNSLKKYLNIISNGQEINLDMIEKIKKEFKSFLNKGKILSNMESISNKINVEKTYKKRKI